MFILVREDTNHADNAFPDDNKGCESVLFQMKLFKAKLLNIDLYKPPNTWNGSLTSIQYDIGNTMRKCKHMQCASTSLALIGSRKKY